MSDHKDPEHERNCLNCRMTKAVFGAIGAFKADGHTVTEEEFLFALAMIAAGVCAKDGFGPLQDRYMYFAAAMAKESMAIVQLRAAPDGERVVSVDSLTAGTKH